MKFNGKIIRSAFILVLLLGFTGLNSFGQQVIWANKNNLDKRTDFTKVIGQNKYGIYVLKHKNSTFRRYYILEHFDKKMNLLGTKTFRIPNSELEKIVVHSSGIIVFTREYIKGNFNRLLYQSIDSGMNETTPKAILANGETQNEITNIRIEYNTSRDKFMVWHLRSNENKTTLGFTLLNRTAVIQTGQYDLNMPLNSLFIGDAVIDDIGNLFVFYTRSEKFKSKMASDFEHRIFAINIKNPNLKDILINNDKTFISAYKLIYNPEYGTVTAFGLIGESDEDENKGYFAVRMRCSDQELMSTEFQNFDRKIVSQILGIKNEQNGDKLNKFKIKKLIPKTDGGMMAICERTFVTTQSDIFYVNGIPQSSYARIFNNDEVLLLNLDSNGIPLWTDVINKNQSSINDGGYYNGIVIMVNEETIHILYNDRLSANADIIQVSYRDNGEHVKKILINNEEFYALLIPSEYNQVSANSMVLPINQNRDFTYIKLLY